MNKKRKIITTSLAVVLAVALLAGGTITYLSDSSETVTNKFNTNEIKVDLDETGADDGVKDDYEIIPGTSEEKDPTITITSTVDSYLYVLVYGNNPVAIEGSEETKDTNYITYDIAEGWTKLAYNNDAGDGYTDETLAYFGVSSTDLAATTEITIYYREVEASDEEQVFHVLKNDVVSYSADITEIPYDDGEIYLAFAAYAIQQKPFSNAADALTRTVVDSPENLTEAISNGEPVTLSDDITVSAADLNTAIEKAAANDTAATIDLNGNTLTLSASYINLNNGENLVIANGVISYNGNTAVGFAVNTGATLTLDNVTYTYNAPSTDSPAAILVPAGTTSAEINIENSTITSSGYYVIGTNATTPNTGENVTINITNSELTVVEEMDNYYDSAAVLFNILGTLNITDSTLTGQRQGVIVRCGTANIKNSTITTTAEYTGGAAHLDADWKSGNEVPMAALVAGDRNSAYPGNVTVTLDGVTLTVRGKADTVPAIYLSTDDYNTTVTGAAPTDTVLVHVGTGAITIDTTTVGSEVTTLTTVADLTTAVSGD